MMPEKPAVCGCCNCTWWGSLLGAVLIRQQADGLGCRRLRATLGLTRHAATQVPKAPQALVSCLTLLTIPSLLLLLLLRPRRLSRTRKIIKAP